jgi:hypothetical protein
VGLDAAPQRVLGGDQHRIGTDFERRDAELFQMCGPRPLIGKAALGMFGKPGDQVSGQRAFAHIGERYVVDDVIAMAGAQQAEEIEPAHRVRGGEGGEVRVANLGAEAVLRPMTRPGVVHGDPGAVREAGTQHIARFVAEAMERASYVLPTITWQNDSEGVLSLQKIGSDKRFRVTRFFGE